MAHCGTKRPLVAEDSRRIPDRLFRCPRIGGGVIADPERAAQDLDFCRASADNTLFVGLLDGSIVATIMAGLDGHRGWFHYVAVDPDRHGEGLGRHMVARAETWLAGRGAVKVELMTRDLAP